MLQPARALAGAWRPSPTTPLHRCATEISVRVEFVERIAPPTCAKLDWNVSGLQGIYQWEQKHYLGYARKWRDIPKPSIAAVQGVCIAGGLLLAWPCDLIIAADNATFSDPVVNMGIGGVEYHGHTWEWGPRKAKELLFTGRKMGAEEAERLGMVNKVVPLDDLRTETRALAAEIATKHPFALRQAKRAVNQTLDVMGFYAAIQAVFDIHQTGHGNALSESGLPILMLLDEMKSEIARPKEKTANGSKATESEGAKA